MSNDISLTKPQIALLRWIAASGTTGVVVPGTKGSTARVLREALLIENAVEKPGTCWCGKCAVKVGIPSVEVKCLQATPSYGPKRQRALDLGLAFLAKLDATV